MGGLFGGGTGGGGGSGGGSLGGGAGFPGGGGSGGLVQPAFQLSAAQGGGATESFESGFPPAITQILNSSGGGVSGGGFPGGVGSGVGDASGGLGGFGGVFPGGAVGGGGAAFEPDSPNIPDFGLVPPGSFDPGGQQPGGFGGLPGIGQTLGNTFSVDQSQTRTGIAPEQSSALGQAIQAAVQLAGQQLDPASAFQNFLGGAGANLFGLGQNFLGGIGEAQQGLLGLEDPSIVEGRIGALGTDIQRFLREAIGGAGGIRTEGALSGNLGGGRGQVREGIATRGATDAFARESALIRESAAGRRLEGLLGGAQAGQIGLGGAENLFNLGLAPSIAQFGPLAALAGIIGDPKVLTETLQQGISQGVTGGEGTGDLLGGIGGLLEGIAAI